MVDPNDKKFEESKIFERLESKQKPPSYNGKLPWTIQQQIAATNGVHYVDRIGKLSDYPRYVLPVPKVSTGLMLDIGCGWGRWLISGSERGYIPIGVDIRLEFCETSIETLRNNNRQGYAVVADLKELPFKDRVFAMVWSFSVIQHTHKERMTSCIEEIHRVLIPDGFAKLEFPNKEGLRNSMGPVLRSKHTDDYNSWDVRYYSIREYQEIVLKHFNNFKFSVHSFLGIGVLKEDLKYVSLKNKMMCALSLLCTGVSKVIKPLARRADSIYVTAVKRSDEKTCPNIDDFIKAHQRTPDNNLNIIHLLRCPVTSSELTLSSDEQFLHNGNGTLKYRVINRVPILIRSQAIHI